MSIKNELMDVKDAYILISEIRVLVLIIKKKDIEQAERKSSTKSRKGII